MAPVEALTDHAERCARTLADAADVRVVTHDDADGLTAGAIAAEALDRAEIPASVRVVDGLSTDRIESIAADGGTVWFTDIGSGQLDAIAAQSDWTPVVADHHQIADASIDAHCNPMLAGLDGASDLSGAGAVYLVARALVGSEARDLAAQAVVGAVGDRQLVDGELVGANAAIVDEGEAVGVIERTTDLDVFGRQTRPLPQVLASASVSIPGVLDDPATVTAWLATHVDDPDQRWADCAPATRQTIASALFQAAIERGVPADRIDDLVGTAYTLAREPDGTALRDAAEFATLLNATARYDESEVGIALARGERGDVLDRARELLETHRENLSAGVDLMLDRGTTTETAIQWVDLEDAVRPTIVGIVASLARSELPDRPIIAFADDDGDRKVSARGPARLVRAGLNLGVAMDRAATHVGGEGGGHDIAAGATIPAGSERAFLDEVDAIVAEQVGGAEGGPADTADSATN
ncbi:single-stranded-DNA-specific exonuclease RecJ [Halococcoides cellulosivorans]|uniref:Recombinase RecJ n=1 Tax=Halococcoides cellulosivorans TaxID=1679096 RepID=A0A2R4WZH5_9EURY|nr:DHH family phosphoesterase [Halococcoides cellulosivorans]AWB26939.1 recombinase RecJ [Halococcoides cellulosivorans]